MLRDMFVGVGVLTKEESARQPTVDANQASCYFTILNSHCKERDFYIKYVWRIKKNPSTADIFIKSRYVSPNILYILN